MNTFSEEAESARVTGEEFSFYSNSVALSHDFNFVNLTISAGVEDHQEEETPLSWEYILILFLIMFRKG